MMFLEIDGIPVEQRMTDGFINATAMCRSQGKRLIKWFENEQTRDLFEALADDLGIETQSPNSDFATITDFSRAYPELIITRRGGRNDTDHTWLHPDLAVQLAQWCKKLP